jgi:hypothetical protein
VLPIDGLPLFIGYKKATTQTLAGEGGCFFIALIIKMINV